ncbi:Host cell factor [Thelohanellus kitauei]|uniref:Host cell factor n=1 Tax=Thelohanellus kitauei TaxID=669202 RepID=A0A0C2N0Y7_THEKT|nr:Host cell factor [Thelohanellus kitauei]
MEEKMFKATQVIQNLGMIMFPMNRVGHRMIAIDELVIIYGGYTFPGNGYDELWIYDCTRQKWRLFTLPDLLKDTCKNSSICANGSKIYIFGAPDMFGPQDIQNTLFAFDVRTLMWMDLFKELKNSEHRPPNMKTSNVMYDGESIYILGIDMDDVGVMYKFCLKKFLLSVITHVGDLRHPDYPGHCTLFKKR